MYFSRGAALVLGSSFSLLYFSGECMIAWLIRRTTKHKALFI